MTLKKGARMPKRAHIQRHKPITEVKIIIRMAAA